MSPFKMFQFILNNIKWLTKYYRKLYFVKTERIKKHKILFLKECNCFWFKKINSNYLDTAPSW